MSLLADPREIMEEEIRRLRSRSSVVRRQVVVAGSEEFLLFPNNHEVRVREIRDSEDPALRSAYELVAGNFPKQEVDSLKEFGERLVDSRNACHVIERGEGDVLALCSSQYLPLQVSGNVSAVLFILYIVTHPDYRKNGYATELYQILYSWMLIRAKEWGHSVRGVIGETVSGVERLLNEMGRKRLYFRDPAGNVQEVPYMTLSSRWDVETGNPLYPSAPLHLMLKLLDGRERLSVEDLLSIVHLLYTEQYPGDRSLFRSEHAYQCACQSVEQSFHQLERALFHAQEHEVFLMNAEERKRLTDTLVSQGLQLIEHL